MFAVPTTDFLGRGLVPVCLQTKWGITLVVLYAEREMVGIQAAQLG